MAICSICGKDKDTVDRNEFDGMCSECLELSFDDPKISAQAIKNNESLIEAEIFEEG